MIPWFAGLYLRHGELLRYLLVGGGTTLLNIGVFALMNILLGAHYQLANAAAWVVAVAFAFAGNKWIVFRSKAAAPAALLREGAGFVASRLLTLLFSAVFLHIAVSILGANEPLAKVISTAVEIVLNYVLAKAVVFRGQAGKQG